MSSSEEIRIFLNGEEYEVRKLSAAALLNAKKTARELMEKNEYADEDGKVVLAAAIAAESIRFEGEPVFATAEEAMESMTAGELFEVSSYGRADKQSEEYDEPYLPRKEPDELEKSAQEVRKSVDDAIMTLPEKMREKEILSDAGEVLQEKRIESPESAEVRIEKRVAETIRREMEVPAAFRTVNPGEMAGRTRNMEYVSGFFERDSRRYGEAFERY